MLKLGVKIYGTLPYQTKKGEFKNFTGAYQNPGNDPEFACGALFCRGTGREHVKVTLNNGQTVIVRRLPL